MIPTALALLAIRDYYSRRVNPNGGEDPMTELMRMSNRSAEECHLALVKAVEDGYAVILHDYELTAAGRRFLQDEWRNFIKAIQG
jgi:hypothetical protein